jgi:hypothetical protein
MIAVEGWGAATIRSRAQYMIDLSIEAARNSNLRSDSAISKWLGIIVSAVVLGVAFSAARGINWTAVWLVVSANGLFWVALTATYFHAPVADIAMLGRLWNNPKGLFSTLCRKQIVNAVALPYAGDGLLLAWARGRGIRAFGPIKDAAILSGIVGSLLTFIMVLPVWRSLAVALNLTPSSLFGSLGLLSAAPLVALLNRTSVFSLASSELCLMGAIHVARISASIVLMALCWHSLLPAEPVQSWLLLAAARMVVSRLPLLPNKELALAAVATAMFPDSPQVGTVVMVTGLLLTLGHLVVWSTLLIRKEDSAAPGMSST